MSSRTKGAPERASKAVFTNLASLWGGEGPSEGGCVEPNTQHCALCGSFKRFFEVRAKGGKVHSHFLTQCGVDFAEKEAFFGARLINNWEVV